MSLSPDQYLDALLTLPEVYRPAVSRDGRWVAWTWYRTGPAADVYVAPTDGSAAPLRLTETPDDTIVVSWTPDSHSLIVAQDRDGNERAQLFRVHRAQPGVLVPLTEPDPAYFVRGGSLHPNGRWLVYAANYDFAAGTEIEPSLVYRHDLRTGERRVLASPNKPAHFTPELNEAGTHILYARKDEHAAGRQVWLVDINGREDREILNFGPQIKVFATWFPDNRRVLVLSEAAAHRRVGVWDMADASLRWLIDDPNRNIESAYMPLGSDRAVILEVSQARTRASLLDPETGDETRLPDVPGTLVPLAPLRDGQWVGSQYSSTQPIDLVRFAASSPDPESTLSLTRIWERTSLAREDLTAAQDFRWRSVDGLEIQGWLYRPTGPARGTIAFVHGGPTWHSEDWIDNQIQFLVNQGFNVLDPNYRGSTGFGLAFQEAIKADGWGGREQDDIRTGIEALIAAGIAERGKVGVTGTSFGGYSAWCAITHQPTELVTAAAPICGMTDLVVDYETTRPDLRPHSEEMIGGRPDQIPDRYRERSPLHFVSNIKGRLLIVQGRQDPNVTPENVRVVRAALDKAGIEYQLLVFEDEGHGIHRPKNQKALYLQLAKFFGDAFGG